MSLALWGVKRVFLPPIRFVKTKYRDHKLKTGEAPMQYNVSLDRFYCFVFWQYCSYLRLMSQVHSLRQSYDGRFEWINRTHAKEQLYIRPRFIFLPKRVYEEVVG